MALIRVLTILFLATGVGLCQQGDTSLPDTPSPGTDTTPSGKTESLRTAFEAAHLSPVELANEKRVGQFDRGHFASEQATRATATDPFKRLFVVKPVQRSADVAASKGLMKVATDAASSLLVTRDGNGKRHLNTPYLLRVLTYVAADSAHTPYWRRSMSQPASDFGSTVGNDAGMKVFHVFEPGLLQMMKSHEPKFVAAIAERAGKR